jgi:phosphohistidine phosphatase
MIELMLMRHAKSDWHSHMADIDRPLNSRGCDDALAMGAFLTNKGLVPNKMIISPARRTQQTAELLLKNLPVDEQQVIIDRDLYLADVASISELIELYAVDEQRILLLAHNPGMDDMVSYIASSAPTLSANGKLMTTCAVAHFALASVNTLRKPGNAEILGLYRPKEITI